MVNEQDFIKFITIKLESSENTVRHCTIRLRVIKRWFIDKDLTKENVEQFFYELKEKKLSNAALNTYVLCFRYIEYYLKDRGSPTDLLNGIKSFKKIRQKPIEVLDAKQIEKLLSVKLSYKPFRGQDTSILDKTYNAFTMTLAYTGSRFDETASLLVKHVHLDNGRISLPDETTKNKTGRNLYITEPLISKLKDLIKHKKDNDLVFTNFMGNKIKTQDYNKDLKMRGKASGISQRLYPHLLRHTYGTSLYVASRDIGLVQLVLGHKDIKSTMIYIHLADEVVRNGMRSHPFIKHFVPPIETVLYIEKQLQLLKLEDDPRFDFVKTKQSITDFINSLHSSIKFLLLFPILERFLSCIFIVTISLTFYYYFAHLYLGLCW